MSLFQQTVFGCYSIISEAGSRIWRTIVPDDENIDVYWVSSPAGIAHPKSDGDRNEDILI